MNDQNVFPAPPAGHFITVVSMIYGGCFQPAGQPTPLSELQKIPRNLRKPRYLLFPDPHAKPSNGDARNLIYETNTHYSVDDAGDYHQRQIARQINLEAMRIEAAEELERQLKEEIENPDPTTAAAMKIVQEDHDINVSAQIAQGQYLAKERELADQAAKDLLSEQGAEVAGITDQAHVHTPSLAEPAPEAEEPKPQRVLKTLYVIRAGRYLRARKVPTLRVNEPVYTKEGTEFVQAGKVNRHKKLPLIWKD